MFLVGSQVQPGLLGEHPSLDDLEQGDLKHRVDFRQVYSCVLQHWLGCDSQAVLGQAYAPVDALRA
jgi:uncharacterized protein (DUF1501 family)